MDGAVMAALLEELADVNARDLGGFTPLMTLGKELCGRSLLAQFS